MDAGFQIPYPVENNCLCMFDWIAVPLFLYCMLCMWLCAGRNHCWLPAVLWSVCWVLGCTEAWWSCVISLQDSRKSVVNWKLLHAATNLIYEHYYLAQNTSASFLRQKYGVTTYVENIWKVREFKEDQGIKEHWGKEIRQRKSVAVPLCSISWGYRNGNQQHPVAQEGLLLYCCGWILHHFQWIDIVGYHPRCKNSCTVSSKT